MLTISVLSVKPDGDWIGHGDELIRVQCLEIHCSSNSGVTSKGEFLRNHEMSIGRAWDLAHTYWRVNVVDEYRLREIELSDVCFAANRELHLCQEGQMNDAERVSSE